jgi:predicted Zn-dependent protease
VAWKRRPGVAGTRRDYLMRLEGIVVGTSGAEGAFIGERFIHPDLDFGLRFPDGWETMNTHTAVGAVSPLLDAQIVVEGQEPARDPEAAAAAYLSRPANAGIPIDEAAPLMIGRLPAYRVKAQIPTPYGWLPVQLTWVVRGDGGVFRFTGVAAPGAFHRYQTAFGAVVRSFRPLTPQQRNAVRETRVHLVEAHAGETIAALTQRTSNEWDVQTTAVVNGIFSTTPFEGGELVKIAISEPYLGDRAQP